MGRRWTEERVNAEIDEWQRAHGGKPPTYNQLWAAGRGDLAKAIERCGGMTRVLASAGLPQDFSATWREPRVPDREWVEGLVAEFDHLPSDAELRALGRYADIKRMVTSGGYRAAADILGVEPATRRWDYDAVAAAFLPLVRDGRLTVGKKALTRDGLSGAIQWARRRFRGNWPAARAWIECGMPIDDAGNPTAAAPAEEAGGGR